MKPNRYILYNSFCDPNCAKLLRNTHTPIGLAFQYTARTNSYFLGTYKLEFTPDANNKSTDLKKNTEQK